VPSTKPTRRAAPCHALHLEPSRTWEARRASDVFTVWLHGKACNTAAFDTSCNNLEAYADSTVATADNGVPEPGYLALLG
jgi:hypothetical protein